MLVYRTAHVNPYLVAVGKNHSDLRSILSIKVGALLGTDPERHLANLILFLTPRSWLAHVNDSIVEVQWLVHGGYKTQFSCRLYPTVRSIYLFCNGSFITCATHGFMSVTGACYCYSVSDHVTELTRPRMHRYPSTSENCSANVVRATHHRGGSTCNRRYARC